MNARPIHFNNCLLGHAIVVQIEQVITTHSIPHI